MDMTDINVQVLLSPYHMEKLWSSISATSTTTPPDHPTSDSAIQTIQLSLSNDEFKEALSKDNIWKEAVKLGKDNWKVIDGIILYRDKIYVPLELRPHILSECHDSPLAGHSGHAKTTNLILRDYNWPGLSTYVRHYVHSCDLCQRTKADHHVPYGKLMPLEIPARNWDSISMDFITDLPISHSFDAILVVVDRLSKQAHFIPTHKSLDAPGLAQLFISNIAKLHGFPSSIVSD
jgi:hypothetical protein